MRGIEQEIKGNGLKTLRITDSQALKIDQGQSELLEQDL